MHDAYLRQSPLAHLHLEAAVPGDADADDAAVSIAERPHRCQVGIRGNARDPVFMEAASKVLGVDLPVDPCTVQGDTQALHVLWLGPDEWLAVDHSDRQERHLPALQKALAPFHAATWDVSDSRTILHLASVRARQVLMKGCAVDLHPRVFGSGRCVSTHLAKAHVILHQTSDDAETGGAGYDVYVHRSFAEYLWAWLQDAGREYGMRAVRA